MNLLNLIEDANTGYDNLRALMQAVQNSQDAVLNISGEPITLTYPEARFMFGKYKAYNKAGRQEEFIADLGNPVKFDLHMKQLRQLLDKQKNFRGSVPGQRGVTGDVPQGQLSEIGNTPAGHANSVAEEESAIPKIGGWIHASPKVDGSEHYARYRNLDTGQDETKTFSTLEALAKWLAAAGTGFDWAGYAPNPALKDKLLGLYQQYDKKSKSLDELSTGTLNSYVNKARAQVRASPGANPNNSHLPTDPKIANRARGAVKADNRLHGFGPAKKSTQDMAEAEPVTVEEIAMNNPDRPTTETAGKINWERMIKDYMDNKPYTEFEFGTDRPLTIYRSQVYAILKDFGRMKPPQKVNIILSVFGDKAAMVDYIDKLRAKGLMPKKVPAYVAPGVEPVPPGQMSFPGMAPPKIKEAQAQKKNSNQAELGRDTARSPKVQRAFQLARARQAAAGSDIEAFVKDELEKAEQAQAEIEQLRSENDRQDQQIQQLATKVRQQDQEINQVQQPTVSAPAKVEPPKGKPRAAEPDKKAQPIKKAEPPTAQKPAEPARRDEPRAEPDTAPKTAPKPAEKPKQDRTKVQTPKRRKKKSDDNVIQGPWGQPGATPPTQDDIAAAMAGIDLPMTGTYGGQPMRVQESDQELHIGDPVIIQGSVEFDGKTGDVVDFGRDKHFVIVDLYNFGQHAFHASNVKRNDYANSEDYLDEMQTKLDRVNINRPPAGGTNKEREAFLDARDRLFRQMQNATPGEKEAIRLKIVDLEGQAQAKGIKIREAGEFNRSGHNAIRDVSDWEEKMRVMRELMKDQMLMSDPEARAAIQQRIGDLIRVGQQQGYINEALNDKAMAVLRGLKSQTQATQPTALNPAQQAEVDAWAQDVERNLAPKLKKQFVSPAIDLNVPKPQTAQDTLPDDLPTLRRRIEQLDQLIKMKEMIDRLFIKAQNVRGGIYPGLQSDIEDEEMYGVPQTDKDYEELKNKYARDLSALQKFLAMKKAVYREGQDRVSESTALVRLKQARQALSQQSVTEVEGDDIWGPQGNFAGDTPVNIDGATMKMIQVGDVVKYFGEKARVVELSPANNYARITANGKTLNVRMSDLRSLGQGLKEFAPAGRDPWGDDDRGEDPYGRPRPKHYNRSIDFFGQFEADHFDDEVFDEKTGVFKGYWDDKEGRVQIAYFKFDDLTRTGSDDPGMGWYYEPKSDGNSNNTSAKPAVDTSAERKQQELGMIDAFLKSGKKLQPGSQIYALMKKHGLAEGLADEFMAMAKAKGMNPRLRGTPDEERAKTDAMIKQRAADRAAAPKPAGPDAEERARLEAKLKELEAKFDPDFEYSDDHSFWSRQNELRKQIGSIKQRLSQGVAEAQTDYQKRRQRERDVDAGRPVKPLPKNSQTDYAKKRAKDRRDQDLGEEQVCSECGGPAFSDLLLAEKQDACYHKVKSRYKVWPSAYASGALVQCRKKGAANWGNGGKKE